MDYCVVSYLVWSSLASHLQHSLLCFFPHHSLYLCTVLSLPLVLTSSHCPWVGNCIGERNHRVFFVFLIAMSGLTILSTATAVQVLTQVFAATKPVPASSSNKSLNAVFETCGRLWHVVAKTPIVFLFGAFTMLCAWSLLSLLLYHAMIISVAQTTNERVRNVYHVNANEADVGCIQNWVAALCSRIPKSSLPDFSQTVKCDWSNAETMWRSHSRNSSSATLDQTHSLDDGTAQP